MCLSTAVSLLNPDVVVIGGDVAHAHERFMLGVRDTLLARSQPLAIARLTIAPSALGDRAGIIGSRGHGGRCDLRQGCGRRRYHVSRTLDVPDARSSIFELLAQSRVKSAYFVVARRRKNVSARSSSARRRAIFPTLAAPSLSCSRNRAWNPPTSSSLADEERVCSLLLSTAARDFRRSQLHL